MEITKEGNIIIHKETWATIINDAHYKELADEIEDMEAHYESMLDEGKVSFDEYVKKRKKDV